MTSLEAPKGAITPEELKKMRTLKKQKTLSSAKVYFVRGELRDYSEVATDRFGVMHGFASEYGFDCTSPDHYFLNYWMAYAYALKRRSKDHD